MPQSSGPALFDGRPDDASEPVRIEADRYDEDAHSWGWADGSTVLGWTHPRLERWANALRDVLDSFAVPAPIPVYRPDYGLAFDGDSIQETARRRRIGATLPDWREHPESWRVIVYYDN